MATRAPVSTEARPLHVVATAGHVDHGKSALIARLTGIDPDRWEEEKRRGLTIDLGFAWATLPSGDEVGFVDVPGHERFVRNMLAGVGPVKLVLFVVAADEGWKPQSEEHLAIVDVLEAESGVVALTKRDLVDEERFAARERQVRDRLAGTALADAPIVPCSAVTERGVEGLREALDAMVSAAPPPPDRGRPRIHIDRSFTIKGAGTVVTGTLTGGPLRTGAEVELYPSGRTARVRSLQTHRRSVEVARPVSRVAANLAGTTREEASRGDVLALPGQWRPTATIEVRLHPIRSLEHALSARGAYKLYVGSAERDARLRLYGMRELATGGSALARLRLSHPVVVDVGERFVLRETGRRETVAGGVVLDPHPPGRPGRDAERRLRGRESASWDDLPSLLVRERGVLRAADLPPLTGLRPDAVAGATPVGAWWVADAVVERLADAVRGRLARFHGAHPLRPGLDAADVRLELSRAAPELSGVLERGLAAAILEHLETRGDIAREGTLLRLAAHRVTLGEREEEASRLVEAVAEAEPNAPTIRELEARGFPRDLVEAACTTGRLVGVSSDLVFTPGFVARAERVVRDQAGRPEGLTVSGFRQTLGTTRKYALPLLEHFDQRGVTRRDGDVRRLADRTRPSV